MLEVKNTKTYWDNRYVSHNTGWDLGEVSPPLKKYIDTIKDKNSSILIPGCGSAYEALYLLQKGFTNITLIDISSTLVQTLKEKFKSYSTVNVIEGNFFDLNITFDMILEQTFFCALNPTLRQQYVQQINNLLKPNGILAGVLFNVVFDKEGPPFGGTIDEYELLFKPYFNFKQFEQCNCSHAKRQGQEIFIELIKL